MKFRVWEINNLERGDKTAWCHADKQTPPGGYFYLPIVLVILGITKLWMSIIVVDSTQRNKINLEHV